MLVKPGIVSIVDWATLGVSGAIAAASLVGALYAVPWTRRGRRMAATRAFNYLWVTRAMLQLTGALYALALNLRLQVLWSYRSALIPGGYNVDPMCRLFIGLTFGFLEPAFLLLVLFSCMYTVHKHGEEVGPNPNLFIFALTVGLTLPMCAAQVFAALFSRIITQLRYHEDLMKEFFAASINVSDAMCPPQEQGNPNCAVCVFPAFSTIISAAFGLVYLLSLWYITRAIARAAINKMLARRIRALQLTVTASFCVSVALRGVTVRFYPYSLGFVALCVAGALVICAQLVAVSFLLGWVPVGETRAAGRSLAALLAAQGGGGGGGGGPGGGPGGGGGGGDLEGATELLPLVDYQAAASFDFDDGGSSARGSGSLALGPGPGPGPPSSSDPSGGGGGGGAPGATARRRGGGEGPRPESA